MSNEPVRMPMVVRLTISWGDRCLLTRLIAPDAARAFTVGSAPGCDFALSARDFGAARHALLSLSPGCARVLLPASASGVRFTTAAPEGEALAGVLVELEETDDGHRALELSPEERARFDAGPLTFDVGWVRAPRRVPRSPADSLDYTAANVALCVTALAVGLILTAHLNGVEREDDEPSASTAVRMVKVLHRSALRRAAAPESPQPRAREKEGKLKGPPAEQVRAPPRPKAGPTPPVASAIRAQQVVTEVFTGPGLNRLLANTGLDEGLRAATSGLSVASQGSWAGFGGLGLGLKGDGEGGGGGESQRLGGLATRGRASGNDTYGTGRCEGMACGKERPETKVASGVAVACGGADRSCIDKELIRKTIQRHLGSIRYCYEQRLSSHPGLGGRLLVRFGIPPSGTVSFSEVEHSTVGDVELERCVASRVRLIQFPRLPAGAGLAVIHYPFTFKRAGETAR